MYKAGLLTEECILCGQENEWLNCELILQIDHINGKHNDNRLQNLRILCPNCHSKVHVGEIIIIGVYSTTAGVKSLWFRKGELPPLPKELWRVQNNPLVVHSSKERE